MTPILDTEKPQPTWSYEAWSAFQFNSIQYSIQFNILFFWCAYSLNMCDHLSGYFVMPKSHCVECTAERGRMLKF